MDLKRKYKLILVAGARPNFMKIAPIIRSLKLEEILKGNGKKGKVPDLWDGKAAGRIVSILAGELEA